MDRVVVVCCVLGCLLVCGCVWLYVWVGVCWCVFLLNWILMYCFVFLWWILCYVGCGLVGVLIGWLNCVIVWVWVCWDWLVWVNLGIWSWVVVCWCWVGNSGCCLCVWGNWVFWVFVVGGMWLCVECWCVLIVWVCWVLVCVWRIWWEFVVCVWVLVLDRMKCCLMICCC